MIPIQAVIDTNVLYTAMRSQRGASFQLIDNFMSTDVGWRWNVSNACVLEYEEILLREGFPKPLVEAFLDDLLARASRIRIVTRLRPLAGDPDDDLFAELALAAGADCLVTFNVRDFRSLKTLGIAVVTPREFAMILNKEGR